MKKKLSMFLMLTVLLAIAASPVKAAVSAYAFGDYYFILNSNTAAQENQHGLWLRRVYFTYDADISDKIKARFRLEMNSDGKLGTTEVSLTPYLKDAYLNYKIHDLHSLMLGIQESLTYNNIEKFYGYRQLEKTPFDLYKTRSSRDFGLSLKGSFDSGKKFGYALMYGNNSSNKNEINKYKQVSGCFTVTPNPNWMFEIGGDMVTFSATKKSSLLQGFAGFQGDWGRIGLNYGRETISEDGKDDVNFNMFSAFIVGKLSKKLEAILRYDMCMDPLVGGNDSFLLIEKGYEADFLMAGLALNIHPRFQLIPNIKIVSYKENAAGVAPGDFSQFNITFYYVF